MGLGGMSLVGGVGREGWLERWGEYRMSEWRTNMSGRTRRTTENGSTQLIGRKKGNGRSGRTEYAFTSLSLGIGKKQ